MSTPSVRVAALAFALSSWVEGLTHLRTVLLIPSALERGEENVHQTHPPPAHATWREKIVAWFKRRGRSNAQMDDTERTSMGVVDIAVSIFVLSFDPRSKYLVVWPSTDCFCHSSYAQATITSVSPLSFPNNITYSPFNIRIQAYQVAGSRVLYAIAFAAP